MLAIKNVRKTFDQLQVLKEIQLEVKKGKWFWKDNLAAMCEFFRAAQDVTYYDYMKAHPEASLKIAALTVILHRNSRI